MSDSTDTTSTSPVEDPVDDCREPTPEEDAGPGQSEHAADEGEQPTTAADDVSAGSVVEALLFSTDRPLSLSRIAQVVGVTAGVVKEHIATLNDRYDELGTSFRIRPIAKGYQMLTEPAFHAWIEKLNKTKADSRLSGAGLETLAIVAYKQPVLRADVEAIRGVAVGDMLLRLRDLNLVRIVGRAEEIGRPLLYGTTNRFLDVFGLGSLDDLPSIDFIDADHVPQLKVVESPADDAAGESGDDTASDASDVVTEDAGEDTIDDAGDGTTDDASDDVKDPPVDGA